MKNKVPKSKANRDWELEQYFFLGAVAQLVEQWTENPCVAGSTPAHTTTSQCKLYWFFFTQK